MRIFGLAPLSYVLVELEIDSFESASISKCIRCSLFGRMVEILTYI